MPVSPLCRADWGVLFSPAFLDALREGIQAASGWLANVAQVQPGEIVHSSEHRGYPYTDWTGAIRSDYAASSRKWGFFGPYWHSAQAAKALLAAEAVVPGSSWRESAEAIGAFLLRNRIADRAHLDYGLLLAYEDLPRVVNISAVLESVDGLFALAEATGNAAYQEAAIDALSWVAERAYVKGKGVFHDFYDPESRGFIALGKHLKSYAALEKARPLLDDAVFLTAYRRTGNRQFLDIFLQTAECLLETERPAGNWISFGPCNEGMDYIHPRHAYWWGTPLIDAWVETGDTRFRAAALRSADWYSKALRRDGGFIRNTSVGFNTDSFGHATSGSACAALLLLRAGVECGEVQYLPFAKKALEFCLEVQFQKPQDPNLKGAILEKILVPSGHDASPYHIRDLGTIFYLQAAAAFIEAAQTMKPVD